MLGFVIFVSMFTATTTAKKERMPSILFVMADDLGFADVGFQCKQDPHLPSPSCPHTPHLDAMAASPHTMVFSNFHAGAPNCSPTRCLTLTPNPEP